MMKTTRIAFATLALLAAAGLTACNNSKMESSDSKMEAKATNTTCPFTGGKANPEVTSVCEGKAVAFCCAGCKGKFDKMSEEKQEAMMKNMK